MPDNKEPKVDRIVVDVVDVEAEDYKTLQRLKALCAKEWNQYEKEFMKETKKILAAFQSHLKKVYKVDMKKGEKLIVADKIHGDKQVPHPKNTIEMVKAINLYYLESCNTDKINRVFREYMSKLVTAKNPNYEALYFKRKIFYDLNMAATNKQYKTPRATLKAMQEYLDKANIEASEKRNRAFSKAISSVLIKIAKVLNKSLGDRTNLFFQSHTAKKVGVIKDKIDKLNQPTRQ